MGVREAVITEQVLLNLLEEVIDQVVNHKCSDQVNS